MSIIVAVKDSPRILLRCLSSLERYAPQAEVILVDDGSELSETLAILESFRARNHWVIARHEKSLGHSRTCETGARLATRPYLCLLNSDAIVTPWSWASAKEAFEADPCIGVAGPSTSYAATPQMVRRAMRCRNYWSESQVCAFAKKYVESHSARSWINLPEVGGFAFFIRRSLWEHLGGFDANLPDYGNESELCKRVAQHGFRIIWIQNSYVHHLGHQSYGQLGDTAILQRARTAREYIKEKHGQLKTGNNLSSNSNPSTETSKTTSDPFFSVIIPTYNRALLLKRAIDSVLSQTYADFEILVVDDGSTDETQELLRRYTEESGDRIRTLRQENSGKSVALNEALSVGRGKWITFLDSDDYWLPDKLERQRQTIRNFEGRCGACFTDAKYINNPYLTTTAFERSRWDYEGEIGVISDAVRLILVRNHGVYMQTMAVRADVMRQIGPFDPELRISQDTDFLYRLALKTGFCFVNCALVCIDRTPNRSTGLIELFRDDSILLAERQHMYEKWLTLSCDLSEEARQTIRTRLQEVHHQWAHWYLIHRAYREARHAISTAASLGLTYKILAKWLLTYLTPALGKNIYSRRMRRRAKRQALWYA